MVQAPSAAGEALMGHTAGLENAGCASGPAWTAAPCSDTRISKWV